MLLSESMATPKTPRRWPPAEALVFSRTTTAIRLGSRDERGSNVGSLREQNAHCLGSRHGEASGGLAACGVSRSSVANVAHEGSELTIADPLAGFLSSHGGARRQRQQRRGDGGRRRLEA